MGRIRARLQARHKSAALKAPSGAV